MQSDGTRHVGFIPFRCRSLLPGPSAPIRRGIRAFLATAGDGKCSRTSTSPSPQRPAWGEGLFSRRVGCLCRLSPVVVYIASCLPPETPKASFRWPLVFCCLRRSGGWVYLAPRVAINRASCWPSLALCQSMLSRLALPSACQSPTCHRALASTRVSRRACMPPSA